MLANLYQDPRYFQIVTLSALMGLQMTLSDFGPNIGVFLSALLPALFTQLFFSWKLGLGFDYRSPAITALSLTILLKSGVWFVHPLAAIIAIGSKFLLRSQGKHIFNPANIGIVAALLILPHFSWVSPAQWGRSLWLGFFLVCMAYFVLRKIPSRDMSFLFFGLWATFLSSRAIWLGDPLSITINQLESGALLIFAFFMISDPKTIPDAFLGRAVFALVVCVIAFTLQFEFQVQEALFYALALACMGRPLLDKLWSGSIYQWGQQPMKGEQI